MVRPVTEWLGKSLALPFSQYYKLGMNDVLLWKRLRASVVEDDLAESLQAAARLPLHQRRVFLGLLDRALTHESAKVRAAAVLCFQGAAGVPVWRRLVAALKDSDPLVCKAGVDALRQSARMDPGRWIHALFHSDDTVREHALALGPPEGFWLPFHYAAGPLAAPSSKGAWLAAPGETPAINAAVARAEEALSRGGVSAEDVQALVDLLQVGTDVNPDLRRRASFYLATLRGSEFQELFVPVLLGLEHFEGDVNLQNDIANPMIGVNADVIESIAGGIVALGSPVSENWIMGLVNQRAIYSEDERTLGMLITDASDPNVRHWARDYMPMSPSRDIKLLRLARVFAWGMQLGLYLTGQPFRIEMITGEMDMGYTRLRENKIHITPRPILLGERYGSEVVRGLILHEYGHHLYHKGPEAETVWSQADGEQLGRLLNLVSDEHLERNLRQRSDYFGNLLKLLNAYAFQHNRREISVEALLGFLGERAITVLPRVALGAARKFGHVVVTSGRLLREMEDAGYSFARFMRALRLGLGNRTRDPKVAQALALFRGAFRKSTMPQLLDVARKLREIFGAEADLLEHLSMEGAFAVDDHDWIDAGQRINPWDVNQALEGLASSQGRGRQPGSMPGGLGMNLRPDETFNLIKNIQPVRHDPAAHAVYAKRVAKAARQLRQQFQNLGLGLRPERFRVQGRILDRGRLRDLIVKRDPRILIARKTERITDLFLGVLIDCSGSMAGNKIEQARLFGTLLAEAAKGHAGIDLRIFGFEDWVIWDAGSARRCAVHALHAGNGNNDSAALYHAYQVARASRRQAKLLVMISDGLPAECSVASLRALVKRLTRMNYCCAQVAVQPLSEICFPHYVVVQERDFNAAVAKFGNIVMRLVGQVIGK